MTDKEKAESLGARVEQRINYWWAIKLPSMAAADELTTHLSSNEAVDVIRGPVDFQDEARGIAVGWRYAR